MATLHRHHVVPRHAGGSDDPSNIIEVTVEEHAELHRKRYEETGDPWDMIAWHGLAGLIGKEEMMREIYKLNGEKIREGRRKAREANPDWVPWNKGKKMSEEHKAKLRGRKFTEEHKAKLRGRKRADTTKIGRYERTPEIRQKLSDSVRGFKHSEETKTKKREQNKGRGNPRAIMTMHTFIHEHHGEFTGTRFDLVDRFPDQNLNYGDLGSVAKGKRSHHRGWRLKTY